MTSGTGVFVATTDSGDEQPPGVRNRRGKQLISSDRQNRWCIPSVPEKSVSRNSEFCSAEQHDTGGEENPRMVAAVSPHNTQIVNPIAGSSVAGDADF